MHPRHVGDDVSVSSPSMCVRRCTTRHRRRRAKCGCWQWDAPREPQGQFRSNDMHGQGTYQAPSAFAPLASARRKRAITPALGRWARQGHPCDVGVSKGLAARSVSWSTQVCLVECFPTQSRGQGGSLLRSVHSGVVLDALILLHSGPIFSTSDFGVPQLCHHTSRAWQTQGKCSLARDDVRVQEVSPMSVFPWVMVVFVFCIV